MSFQASFLVLCLSLMEKIHVHLVSFKTQLPEVVTQAYLDRVFLAQNRQVFSVY